MKKRIFLIIFILLFSSIIIIGCITGSRKRLNCICLIDYSGSLSEATLEKYINIISFDIFRNLDEKDRLIVLPIDEGAKIEPVKIIFEDLAEMKFSKYSDGLTHARDSTLKRIRDYSTNSANLIHDEIEKQKEIRKQFTFYTDILSALEQCQPLLEFKTKESSFHIINRFFSGNKKIEADNLIVLFSDMIQESSEYNFNKPSGCTYDESKKILSDLSRNNRLPNFNNCSIFVNGRTGRNNEQVENNKYFWTEYFNITNAKLISYDFDCGKQLNSFLHSRKSKENK